MAEKPCTYKDAKGRHCPRMIESGLFCSIHDPANRKNVCYLFEDEKSLVAEMENRDKLLTAKERMLEENFESGRRRKSRK